jgi:TonB family protein
VLWTSPDSNLSPEQKKIFAGKEVQRRMYIVAKIDPQYTELARQNRVVGKVVLKAVFSRDGTVEDITVVSGLPDGLTDQAVYAVKLIKFIPAMKDGHFVSMWVQLEFNFDLY